MKSKKIVIFFSSLLIIILLGGFVIIKNVKNERQKYILSDDEYVPQEEITEDQMRQTIVSLYFINRDTKQLVPEARLIEIKDILNDPCDKLVGLLIEGPKNEKEERVIPENTKLNKSYMDNDCVVLDFTEEILNFNKSEKKEKENIINSLVNTLTQLTEVNKVKILINGNEDIEFRDVYSIKK